MAREIALTKGYVAIVDDEDFEWLSQHRWCVLVHPRTPSPYAMRNPYKETGRNGTVMMHREIMGAPDGAEVDHINGNGLDNRRSNLRVCTPAQNSMNRRKLKIGGSRYKGVTPRDGGKVWRARIRIDGRLLHLGDFTSEEDAARVYDAKARELFGEFARLNFPADQPSEVLTARQHHKARSGSSQYVGVSRHCSGRWVARIRVDGELRHLGLFGVPEDAARAYDAVALRLRGPSTRLNFPPEADRAA